MFIFIIAVMFVLNIYTWVCFMRGLVEFGWNLEISR